MGIAIVTGSAGLIGSEASRHFAEQGVTLATSAYHASVPWCELASRRGSAAMRPGRGASASWVMR